VHDSGSAAGAAPAPAARATIRSTAGGRATGLDVTDAVDTAAAGRPTAAATTSAALTA
jgi:hypothetical protein